MKNKKAKWGDKLIDKLSKDLISEFPDVKAFSRRNLMYIQKRYLFYSGDKKLVQQAVALITKIPWEHNLAIISKYKNPKEALFICKQGYRKRIVKKCLDSSNRSDLYKRSGKAITNSEITLPLIQSDLAK
ncbi:MULTISPECIES: DUF1016 N-terminal domain-containing protein [unclassified Marinitoga]|uniref:DUF1016 N-terminal domain-containing protein n=1 Tax=unclassified Marinitoga TaxID=2640159 RepID=UPI000699C741|nr:MULTISPECIES: DUF1016 N-terminal domain-containing protein [unclassified Marinitoga]